MFKLILNLQNPAKFSEQHASYIHYFLTYLNILGRLSKLLICRFRISSNLLPDL